jgi:hypothetical protein
MHVKWLTLSSVSSMLQSKHPPSLQRRRENVQRQLPLWPEAERPPQELNLWEDLDPETQRKVIALLSRLIEKAVCPKDENQKMSPKKDDLKCD